MHTDAVKCAGLLGRFMEIKLSSVLVNDQDKALRFYTDVLGFRKKQDIPMGEHRWLTVVSPDTPGDVELLLEPTGFAPAATYQQALYDAKIPQTSFAVADVQAEFKRLKKLKVKFRTKPTATGPTTVAVFEDLYGNLWDLIELRNPPSAQEAD